MNTRLTCVRVLAALVFSMPAIMVAGCQPEGLVYDPQTGQLTPERVSELLQRLDTIEQEVRQVKVPLSNSDELYSLRLQIALVRYCLQQLPGDRRTGPVSALHR